MRVYIAEVKKAVGAKASFELEEPLTLGDVATRGPVYVKGELNNAGSRILVHGHLRGTGHLQCSRCAEEFDYPIQVDFDEEFLPETSEEARSRGEDPWSDLNTYAEEDFTIDLAEVLRQNALAALPIQTLCSEGCKGLCATCGENLNQRECGCVKASPDTRLEGFRALQAKYRSTGGGN